MKAYWLLVLLLIPVVYAEILQINVSQDTSVVSIDDSDYSLVPEIGIFTNVHSIINFSRINEIITPFTIIHNATITITTGTSSTLSINITNGTIYPITGEWNHSGAHYINWTKYKSQGDNWAPTSIFTNYKVIGVSYPSQYNWDITRIVRYWVNGTYRPKGIFITNNGSSQGSPAFYYINSKENYGPPDVVPAILTVNYTINYSRIIVDYTTPSYETSLKNFTLSILLNNITEAIITYNNTNYTASLSIGVSSTNATVMLYTPLINSSSPVNIPYQWHFNSLVYGWIHLNESNDTVSPIKFFPCASGSDNVTATFTYLNEKTLLEDVSVNDAITVNYGLSPSSMFKNLSWDDFGEEPSICIHPTDQYYYVDMFYQFNTTGGFTNRFLLFNHTFTNVSQAFTLYGYKTQEGVSDLRLTVRNQSTYIIMPGILGKLERYYPSIGVYKTVQMDLSSGEFGTMFFNIEEESVNYKLAFYDNHNNLLKRTDILGFSCDLGVCELTAVIPPLGFGEVGDFISIVSGHDNATYSLNWTSLETDGESTVVFRMFQNLPKGTVSICSETQTGSEGSFTCAFGGREGLLEVEVRVINSLHFVYSDFVEAYGALLYDFAGNGLGSFLSIMIIMSLIMGGMFISPAIGVISGAIGVLIAFAFGLVSYVTITWAVIVFVISMVIAAWVKD